jgi:enterochelin esterase family protein
VLYLFHGTGDDEHYWTEVGLAHRILDNLIADGKAIPMIVAMPDGHADGPVQGGDLAAKMRAFEADLLGDVLPLVERAYRAAPAPESRAVAGLSMGSGQAFAIGVTHLDTFSHVCAFSMGRGNAAGVVQRLDPAEVNRKLKLLWVACGRQDLHYQVSESLCEELSARGIRHEWHPNEGGHNWSVWRKYLADVVPRLFR